jgi:hypothetical protein
MKLCSSSSGCKTRPAKGEPPRAGSTPCDGLRNGIGEASACERVGRGVAAPKPVLFPDAQEARFSEGNNDLCVRWARRGSYPAGCSTMARTKRTVQEPGRPSPLLDTFRSCGEPVTRLRRTTRWRAHVSSASKAQNKRPHRGRLPVRGTRTVANGGRESEGCRGALTSGNGVAPGPGRAQAARVGVHFRRAPWPMLGHWGTCHRDV